jgi:hypothetical protein
MAEARVPENMSSRKNLLCVLRVNPRATLLEFVAVS